MKLKENRRKEDEREKAYSRGAVGHWLVKVNVIRFAAGVYTPASSR